ncbi:hypothetical protein AGMMS49975_10810 [Clostridia bacterium]|nr:hypothetical protein AGMMS49975_10810 [Clostridia bacterium]
MRFLRKRRKNLTNSYKTVKALCSGELTEKKSKFTAYVCPVSGEEDAVSFVDKIKRQNHDARHNCYAYRLANGKEKFSDDGVCPRIFGSGEGSS